MKYYSEDEAREVRLALEREVLSWPMVVSTKMFGCPCYRREGKLFAFLVTGGIVLTEPAAADRDTLSREYAATPFKAAGKSIRKWLMLPAEGELDTARVLPFVRRSYESAEEGI
jgi:hypothetical protein